MRTLFRRLFLATSVLTLTASGLPADAGTTNPIVPHFNGRWLTFEPRPGIRVPPPVGARESISGKWASVGVEGGNAFVFNNALGPDGNVWYASYGPSGLLAVTPALNATFFPVSFANSAVSWVSPGPHKDIWFHDAGTFSAGRLELSNGKITEYPLPTTGFLFGMTLGPDGNIWSDCGQGSVICKVVASGTKIGTVTQYNLSGANSVLLAPGHDGNVWFTTGTSTAIGKISPMGKVTLVNGPPVQLPSGIATDATSAYFSTDNYNNAGNAICRVLYKQIAKGYSCVSIPAKLKGLGGGNIGGLALGKHGDLYFPNMGHVGSYAPATGKFTDFGQDPNSALLDSNASASGADGNYWTFSGQSPSTVEVRAVP